MTDTEQVRTIAEAFTDAPTLLGGPLAVRDAAGRLCSWFVPIVADDRLVGFVELLPDLTHRRTSSFRRRPDTVEGCPPATWWVDGATVLDHARSEMVAGERAGEPYLSFDGTLDRLAWAVPVGGPRGPRIVYVAGDAVWSGTATTGLG